MGRVNKHLLAVLLYSQLFHIDAEKVSEIDPAEVYGKLNDAGYTWRTEKQKWGISKKRKLTRGNITKMGFVLCRVVCLTKDVEKVTQDTIIAWELIGYTCTVTPTVKTMRDNRNSSCIYFKFDSK